MLSQEQRDELEQQATLRAETLSEESLRKEAATAFVGRKDADPKSDERVEFEILDRVYTREMIRREFTV
jgi:hypothetical protein